MRRPPPPRAAAAASPIEQAAGRVAPSASPTQRSPNPVHVAGGGRRGRATATDRERWPLPRPMPMLGSSHRQADVERFSICVCVCVLCARVMLLRFPSIVPIVAETSATCLISNWFETNGTSAPVGIAATKLPLKLALCKGIVIVLSKLAPPCTSGGTNCHTSQARQRQTPEHVGRRNTCQADIVCNTLVVGTNVFYIPPQRSSGHRTHEMCARHRACNSRARAWCFS